MNKFSTASQERLSTCHKDLQTLFNTVLPLVDCSILEGHRGEEAQNQYFREGKSQLRYPESKHNKSPSMAVDVAPWPIKWENIERFRFFGAYVIGIADLLFEQGAMAYHVRWGGDFNANQDWSDNTFSDYVHFELIK